MGSEILMVNIKITVFWDVLCKHAKFLLTAGTYLPHNKWHQFQEDCNIKLSCKFLDFHGGC